MKLYEEIQNELIDEEFVHCLELVTNESEIGLETYILQGEEIDRREEILKEYNAKNKDKRFKWKIKQYNYYVDRGLVEI